jgi:hypothetical protein
MPLNELRSRMPLLRQREQAAQSELQSIVDQITNRAAHLRLAETLSAFLVRVRTAAETLEIQDRQRITRLLVKEILIGDDAITIRHSIPIPAGPTNSSVPAPSEGGQAAANTCYLLRSGSARNPLCELVELRRDEYDELGFRRLGHFRISDQCPAAEPHRGVCHTLRRGRCRGRAGASRSAERRAIVDPQRRRVPPCVLDDKALVRPRVEDARLREPPLREALHRSPGGPILLAKAPHRAIPQGQNVGAEGSKSIGVGPNGVISEIAHHDRAKPTPLTLA